MSCVVHGMRNQKNPDVRSGVASNLNPPVEAGYFVDVEAGDRLRDDERWDAHGVPLIGADEDGVWWGTDRAAWVLREHPFTVTIHGHRGRQDWDGHFVGTEADAIEYAETHGVTVDHVESGDPRYEIGGIWRAP